MTIQRDDIRATPTARAGVADRRHAASRAGPQALPYVWGALRIVFGWIFLWAFLDKLFGLGFATRPSGPGSTADPPPAAS